MYMYVPVGCRNDCFSPARSSLRDSLIMEVNLGNFFAMVEKGL